MPARVKICGLKTPEAMAAALDASADFVGLVFFPPSPRNVSIDEAVPLAAQARGRAAIVALLVDADDALIDRVVRDVRPDLLQLHGSETPDRVGEIHSRWQIPVMKAVKVASAADAEIALSYLSAASLVLFDAKPPKGALLPGGNGVAFDWRMLDSVRDKVPFMLSGGLDPDTVGAAIRATGAEIVDVSSGVESAPGEKDAARIRAFVTAARAA